MYSSATRSNDALCTVFETMAQGAAFCKLVVNGDQPSDFLCKSVNAAFERLTGLNTVVGKKASDLPPGIRQKNANLFDLCRRVILTGAPEICETFIEPLGFWLSVFVYRPQDEHFIAIFENITERKCADQTLAKAEERYRRMFNSGSDAVFVYQLGDVGLPNQFIEANDNACRSLGYTREELLRMQVFDVIPPGEPPNLPANAQRLLADGHLTWDGAIVSKGGRRIAVEVNSSLFDIEGSIGVICCVRDITARKDAEAVKAKLEEELRQAQKLESVGRLAGGVAHDFNNLLTVINGYSNFLLAGLRSPDPLRQYAEEIKSAGDRAAVLTKQLLTFSRKQVLQPRALDLNKKVRASLPMLQRLMSEDIALETNLQTSLGMVMVDPYQIEQVIMNLVVNAGDAMPSGGKLDIETTNGDLNEECSAAIHPDAIPGRYVLMTVADTGHGMDAATRQRIFEPFFTTKEMGKGTGLGLANVYGIIRQSGGWIDVWSEVGVGSSFTIYLPRIDENAVGEAKEVNVPTEKGSGMILLVEDQKAVRSFAKAALMQHGYNVIQASSGEEAIVLAKQHAGEILLLLTDVVLPGMNGKELSERLRELRPNLKVLFVSGHTADVITQRGVLNLGVAFLPKPFSPNELATKVRDVLTAPGSDELQQ